MEFEVVLDSPEAALAAESHEARDKLMAKIVDNWGLISELRFSWHKRGQKFQPITASIKVSLDDEDREELDQEMFSSEEEFEAEKVRMNARRFELSRKMTDQAIEVCREAQSGYPNAERWKTEIMGIVDAKTQVLDEQTFKVASLGHLASDDDDEDRHGGGEVSSMESMFSRILERADRQVADIHGRYMEVIDKNMEMARLNGELALKAQQQSQQPPEYYRFRTAELQINRETALAGAEMRSHEAIQMERQKTLRGIAAANPIPFEYIAGLVFQHMQERESGEKKPPPPPKDPKPDERSTEEREEELNMNEHPSGLCDGSAKIMTVIGDAKLEELKEVMANNGMQDVLDILLPLTNETSEPDFLASISLFQEEMQAMQAKDNQRMVEIGKTLGSVIGPAKGFKLFSVLGEYGVTFG